MYVHVADELVRAVDILETSEANLGNDGAELAARSRDTVASTPVTRREGFSGDNEGGGVRAEILEEVGEAIEEHKRLARRLRRDELVVAEAHAAEKDREHGEAHQLDRLASPAVDEEEGCPVPGDEASSGQNHVAYTDVLEVGVHLETAGERRRRATETDGLQDDGRVEAKTVEGNLKEAGKVRTTSYMAKASKHTSSANHEYEVPMRTLRFSHLPK